METHHHPHLEHHKKNWTTYLFEFFMLFLAVFSGFLAENQREHMVEHQREKKYVRQMVADLQADSAFYVRLIEALDSAMINHEKFDRIMAAGNASNYDILGAYMKLQSVYTMKFTNTTYSEMKSSGSFRYIQNDRLAGLIKKYYETNFEYIKVNEELGSNFFNTHMQPFTIEHFRMTDIDTDFEKIVAPNPVFLNRSKETEIRLMNITRLYKLYLSLYLKNAVIPSSKRANELIKMLKEEYHLS